MSRRRRRWWLKEPVSGGTVIRWNRACLAPSRTRWESAYEGVQHSLSQSLIPCNHITFSAKALQVALPPRRCASTMTTDGDCRRRRRGRAEKEIKNSARSASHVPNHWGSASLAGALRLVSRSLSHNFLVSSRQIYPR